MTTDTSDGVTTTQYEIRAQDDGHAVYADGQYRGWFSTRERAAAASRIRRYSGRARADRGWQRADGCCQISRPDEAGWLPAETACGR
jgi:hypothetical protein